MNKFHLRDVGMQGPTKTTRLSSMTVSSMLLGESEAKRQLCSKYSLRVESRGVRYGVLDGTLPNLLSNSSIDGGEVESMLGSYIRSGQVTGNAQFLSPEQRGRHMSP